MSYLVLCSHQLPMLADGIPLESNTGPSQEHSRIFRAFIGAFVCGTVSNLQAGTRRNSNMELRQVEICILIYPHGRASLLKKSDCHCPGHLQRFAPSQYLEGHKDIFSSFKLPFQTVMMRSQSAKTSSVQEWKAARYIVFEQVLGGTSHAKTQERGNVTLTCAKVKLESSER